MYRNNWSLHSYFYFVFIHISEVVQNTKETSSGTDFPHYYVYLIMIALLVYIIIFTYCLVKTSSVPSKKVPKSFKIQDTIVTMSKSSSAGSQLHLVVQDFSARRTDSTDGLQNEVLDEEMEASSKVENWKVTLEFQKEEISDNISLRSQEADDKKEKDTDTNANSVSQI